METGLDGHWGLLTNSPLVLARLVRRQDLRSQGQSKDRTSIFGSATLVYNFAAQSTPAYGLSFKFCWYLGCLDDMLPCSLVCSLLSLDCLVPWPSAGTRWPSECRMALYSGYLFVAPRFALVAVLGSQLSCIQLDIGDGRTTRGILSPTPSPPPPPVLPR